MNKRKLDYPVFLDIEDKCQENLSDSLMMKMIEAFRAIIVKAGYKFGIYCGYSWYQYQLPEGAKSTMYGQQDILIMIPVNYRKD